MKKYIVILLTLSLAFACKQQCGNLYKGSETGRFPFQTMKQTYRGNTLNTKVGDTVNFTTTGDYYNFDKPLLITGNPLSGEGSVLSAQLPLAVNAGVITLNGYGSTNFEVGIQAATKQAGIGLSKHATLDRTYLTLLNMGMAIQLNETGLFESSNYPDTSGWGDHHYVTKKWVSDRIAGIGGGVIGGSVSEDQVAIGNGSGGLKSHWSLVKTDTTFIADIDNDGSNYATLAMGKFGNTPSHYIQAYTSGPAYLTGGTQLYLQGGTYAQLNIGTVQKQIWRADSTSILNRLNLRGDLYQAKFKNLSGTYPIVIKNGIYDTTKTLTSSFNGYIGNVQLYEFTGTGTSSQYQLGIAGGIYAYGRNQDYPTGWVAQSFVSNKNTNVPVLSIERSNTQTTYNNTGYMIRVTDNSTSTTGTIAGTLNASAAGTTVWTVNPRIANTAGNTAFYFRTLNTLNSGAKVFSWANGTNELMSLTHDVFRINTYTTMRDSLFLDYIGGADVPITGGVYLTLSPTAAVDTGRSTNTRVGLIWDLPNIYEQLTDLQNGEMKWWHYDKTSRKWVATYGVVNSDPIATDEAHSIAIEFLHRHVADLQTQITSLQKQVNDLQAVQLRPANKRGVQFMGIGGSDWTLFFAGLFFGFSMVMFTIFMRRR